MIGIEREGKTLVDNFRFFVFIQGYHELHVSKMFAPQVIDFHLISIGSQREKERENEKSRQS